ncbi:MAG: prepilin-type N-terminal cleavage/methylation domain-containing protein [Opitutaceae bacterium]|jgi:general secretion pathway protein G|nr:prepilin-type N-terminal cleavage/methylation domain-containing protein [Opitutaceae bacterium]
MTTYAHEKKSGARRAFTLVELLTVIAIIGILAAIIIPVVGKVRASARSATCLSNLRQIGIATQMYLTENKNIMYPHAGAARWHRYLNPYVKNVPAVPDWTKARNYFLYCPDILFERRANGEPFNEAFVGYLKNAWLGSTGNNTVVVITDAYPPSRVAVIWDDTHTYNPSAPNPDGGSPGAGYNANGGYVGGSGSYYKLAFRHNNQCHVLMLDGHVASLKAGPTKTPADYPHPQILWGNFPDYPKHPALPPP